MNQFGRFLVVTGADAGVRPTHEAYSHYIVTDQHGQVHGHYASVTYAEALAKGLHESELKQIDMEMEKVLVRKE